MCGIAGFLNRSNRRPAGELQAEVMKMAAALEHRGPDDAGFWVDPRSGVALGHRRLAIIDLSAEGRQPMLSESKRYVIIFNGEIYNFPELRERLVAHGQAFRGHSDTEVLLAAFEHWGVALALERSVGMFALALWDRKEETLYLARDRVGEKPLYYGWSGNDLLFGSELKALRTFSGNEWRVDRDALAVFFNLGYIPAPLSIYQGVRKVSPGTFIKFSAATPHGHFPDPQPYWAMRSVAEAGARAPFTGSSQEAIEELERLLKQSIHGQTIADVPVGAFLSGGIDSSTVVALMQAQSSRPVRTFTIGFHEREYNEAGHAAEVAAHLGTDHTELYVTPEEAMAVIPRLAHIYDEPFSDSSQIPTFLVSQLARTQVTVSLSGDAGDELFAGYPRYAFAERLWSRMKLIPAPIRRGIAAALRTMAHVGWEDTRAHSSDGEDRRGSTVRGGRLWKTADRIWKAAELLSVNSADLLYWRLNSHWSNPGLVPGSSPRVLETAFGNSQIVLPGFLERMCYADSVSYLPDDILVKVDRATMAVSLEARVPLLDHRVIEFAWSLPPAMKVRDGQTKWLLRQVLYKYVPRRLIERPKMGFGVPIEQWLRGPLREWAEELLSPARLRREGFLDVRFVRERWEQHLSGRRRWHYSLWGVLMFQAWLENQRTARSGLLEGWPGGDRPNVICAPQAS
jgi:asparagine synthase (glutamine-hydrolysing)